MRPILQSEAAECGLASLAMIGCAQGRHYTLAELRRRFPSSLKGARLHDLMRIAQLLGWRTRALRLDIPDLAKLALPCILHWDLNHFVVLARVHAKGAVIFDPACGERRLDNAEMSRHFTGVALELAPAAGFEARRAPPRISLRQLTGHIAGLWPAAAQLFALSLALQVFVALAPFCMQWVVDQVLVAADKPLLAVVLAGFSLSLLLQTGIGMLRGWAVTQLSARLGLQWTGNVFAHLLRLPLDFFEKRHLGDITSRLGSMQSIQHTLSTSFVEACIDGLMALATLALMLVYSGRLALLTLVAVAAYLAIRLLANRPLRERSERQLVAAARQQGYLLESLRGMQSLKVAGAEGQRRTAFDNLLVETTNQEIRLARFGLGFGAASQLLFGAERLAVIGIGALLVLDNEFSVGMLIAYIAYKDQFAQRMGALIDKGMELRLLRLHAERLADIVLTPAEEQMAHEVAVPSGSGIEVTGLCFRHDDGEPWLLHDLSFTVQPGESVAIIGPSGCGKTTLVKLLLGLLKPSAGTIRIGGHDLQRLGPRALRDISGVVMQDDQLFAGSLAENISFFDAAHDAQRVEAAARTAAVHEEIITMPMGYESLVGDMGSALSGGQKQRILLARALYRRPRLLFLDEATSHLDVRAERLVSEAIAGLALTRVIVAHRPETIASCDRVLLLQQGGVARERCNEGRTLLAGIQTGAIEPVAGA